MLTFIFILYTHFNIATTKDEDSKTDFGLIEGTHLTLIHNIMTKENSKVS